MKAALPLAIFAAAMTPLAASALTPEAPNQHALKTAAAFQALDPDYEDCRALIDVDPETGRIAARQWLIEGGGAAAKHCLAMSDLASGFPRAAAVRLSEIAGVAEDPVTQAHLHAQAADAWLAAAEPSFARSALDAALARAPDEPLFTLIAAKVAFAEEDWQKTSEAVSKAEEANVADADAFYRRGRSKLALGKPREAAEDVTRALSLDPFHLDTLVLRGELAQLGVIVHTNYQRTAPAAE